MVGKRRSERFRPAQLLAAAIRIGRLPCLVFALLWALAGAQAATSEREGVLEIRVKDHREAIGDFSKMILTFDALQVSPKPGLNFWQTDWKNLTPAVASLDLTQYVGKESARVFRGLIPVGAYDAVHLKIKSVDATLKKSSRKTPVKNKLGPIKLAFETSARGATVIVLDLAVHDMSDHPPAGYELNLKGYELYTNGKLIDKVPPG